MREEVHAAVTFLSKFIRSKLSKDCLEQFQHKLKERLQSHYKDHWFPEFPHKGSGYRCIRINGQVMDPIVDVTARESGIPNFCSLRLFPDELTMWIDPNDVSYRIGENGSIGQVEVTPCDQSPPMLQKISQDFTPQILESRKLLPTCKDQFTRGFSNTTRAHSIMGLTPYAAFAS